MGGRRRLGLSRTRGRWLDVETRESVVGVLLATVAVSRKRKTETDKTLCGRTPFVGYLYIGEKCPSSKAHPPHYRPSPDMFATS